MIISEIFYGIKCNRCGETYEDGEHSFWSDGSSAFENASEDGWVEENGRHYCSGCHEVINDETGEIRVYEEYPEYMKTLIKFIDKVLFASREVWENDPNFTMLKCRFYKKGKLDLFEVEYIKNLLGDRFISLDYEEGKYGAVTCFIKFKKQEANTPKQMA